MEENRKENRKSCSYQNGGFVELSGMVESGEIIEKRVEKKVKQKNK